MDTKFQLTPVRLTVLSYVFLIIIGTVLLLLPISTANSVPIPFIDAFFTATSAVCVTGLIVQDTATYFSTFGQMVILVLIQLGGLGIMTLYASLPIIFGKKMKLSERSFFQEIVETDDYFNIKNVLVNIIKYTLLIEFCGAVILTLRFYFLWHDLGKAAYYGVFHAVSAFCNAGFSVFSDSLMGFYGDGIINITIMTLIVLGGLGFVVLQQIMQSTSIKKLSSHTKLVLVLTGIFIFFPSFVIFHIEFTNAFAGMGIGEKVLASFFQVISTRTAGFNSVDVASLSNVSLFFFSIMMFIGAAPGGTGGGVKITTVGLLLLSMRSILKRQEDIECFRKRVPMEIVTKAIAIIAISFTVVTIFMMMVMFTENASFIEVFFEVLSAFGTVGLSMGLTGKLTFMGKVLISLLMFIGRIGSLSLIFLLGGIGRTPAHKYPWGKFMVG